MFPYSTFICVKSNITTSESIEYVKQIKNCVNNQNNNINNNILKTSINKNKWKLFNENELVKIEILNSAEVSNILRREKHMNNRQVSQIHYIYTETFSIFHQHFHQIAWVYILYYITIIFSWLAIAVGKE